MIPANAKDHLRIGLSTFIREIGGQVDEATLDLFISAMPSSVERNSDNDLTLLEVWRIRGQKFVARQLPHGLWMNPSVRAQIKRRVRDLAEACLGEGQTYSRYV